MYTMGPWHKKKQPAWCLPLPLVTGGYLCLCPFYFNFCPSVSQLIVDVLMTVDFRDEMIAAQAFRM